MTSRVLEAPRYPYLNLRVYQDNGSLLAALGIPTDPRDRYVSAGMLYRYCSLVFLFSEENEWAIYKLRRNRTPGPALRPSGRALVDPGNYIVLDKDQNPTAINLTTNSAPRRVTTRDPDTQSRGRNDRDRLVSRSFRNSLRERDSCCAITGQTRLINSERPFLGLDATHVFPVCMIEEWRRDGYRKYITDTRPHSDIGESGLYSAQNGLLRADIHPHFDGFQTGIDPDSDYEIIVFGLDPGRIGGTRLKESARNGPGRVSADLLRWHLHMCLYSNLKANTEPKTIWEEDLGEDPMSEILSQSDAAQRMEVELFTRLGGLIA
ncbi:hypothetical protein PENFLA_c009G09101 [Penicillium flavigenum]|uniref:HNH nuclease domain-containing protein n=1 Tax=Penicillium flavigenum TaxID=254877 RepID=A0A1V6TEH0_9EURO|nr:hypothetical protein PENFLA_c009G09101 [Penicillium flavigenum]